MFTRDELIAAANTRPIGGILPMRFAGGAIDSRMVQRGELFIALRGEQTDGHLFIGAAVRAGASAILCSRPHEEALARGIPQLVVQDPLDVLQRLAQRHLRRHPSVRVIAVTGSNGKTSVKEATAWLLQSLAPTLKTYGNLNTETGLPLTLLRLNPEHRFAVLEMGAQWVGEIARLCRIAPPDIAVVTVVGPEHLEFFGSMENVALAESEAVAALPSDGVAVLNDDDRVVRRMVRRTSARVVTYGHRPNAAVRAQRVSPIMPMGLSYRFTLSYGNQVARVVLNTPGAHAVTTALAAAGVALNCGMSVQAVAAGLGEIRTMKGRGAGSSLATCWNSAPMRMVNTPASGWRRRRRLTNWCWLARRCRRRLRPPLTLACAQSRFTIIPRSSRSRANWRAPARKRRRMCARMPSRAIYCWSRGRWASAWTQLSPNYRNSAPETARRPISPRACITWNIIRRSHQLPIRRSSIQIPRPIWTTLLATSHPDLNRAVAIVAWGGGRLPTHPCRLPR